MYATKRLKQTVKTNQGVSPDLIPVTVWGVIFSFLPFYALVKSVRGTCKLFKNASYQKHACTHLRIGNPLMRRPGTRALYMLEAFEKEGHPLESISTHFDHSLYHENLADNWWNLLSKRTLSFLKVLKREDPRCFVGIELPLFSMWSDTLEELDLFQCQLLDFPKGCLSKEEAPKGPMDPFLKLRRLNIKTCSHHQDFFLENPPDFEPILRCLVPIISQTCTLKSLDIKEVSRIMAYDVLLHLSGFARHLTKLVLSVSKKSMTIICACEVGLDFPNLEHLEIRNIPSYFIATQMCQPMPRLKFFCWTDPSRNSAFAKISVLRTLQCLQLEMLEMDNLEVYMIPKILEICRHLKHLEAGPVYCDWEAINELGINQKVVKIIPITFPKTASECYADLGS